VTGLDALLRAEAGSFFLETVRITGLIIVAPLPWTIAPARFRAVLVLLLTLAAHGANVAPQHVPGSSELIAFAVASEFVLGAALGFVVRLLVAIAEMVADVIAPQIGLGAAQIFDPQTSASATPLTGLFRNLAVFLALIAGVHRVVIGSLLVSFRLIPPGAVASAEQSVPVILQLSAQALAAGVRLALPVIAILFITQVALSFISRAAPAMQIFSVGFAVTLTVGMLVVFLILPDFGHEFLAEASHVGTQIETLLVAFGGRP
jgi:flagellar biosynthetic protein FliR